MGTLTKYIVIFHKMSRNNIMMVFYKFVVYSIYQYQTGNHRKPLEK